MNMNQEELDAIELHGQPQQDPTLTYRARASMYQKYMGGAHVRDLANEYGLLPSSVKAYIWLEQLYWEQVSWRP